MDKIKWCKKQNSGIEIVEENQNLSEEYFKKAEKALKAVKSLEGNEEWQISSAYYAMYFSLYAILMKIGIKCEIHSCTIDIMKKCLNQFFSLEEMNLIKTSLVARIDSQYYTDRDVKKDQRKKMVDNAPKFYLKCKNIVIKLKNSEVCEIRDYIVNK
jgi:uncharacterized protein (UPF0332 family)